MDKEIEISPRQIANAINDLLNEKEQLEQENAQLKDKIYRAIHLIQLIQMDGEVTISDLSKIVNELQSRGTSE